MYWIKWFFSLIYSVCKHGINLYTILDSHHRISAHKVVLIIEDQQIDCETLKYMSDQYIAHWHRELIPNKIGLMLENSLHSIAALFALSRLGKELVILNPNLVEDKLKAIIEQQLLFIFCSAEYAHKVEALLKDTQAKDVEQFKVIDQQFNIKNHDNNNLKPSFFNLISVCSSGSTGIPKIATRQSKPWQAIALLDLLLIKLKFFKIKQIFIMTPICHAAGLTASILALSFAKTVILQSRFDAKKAIKMIEKYQVDSLNLVPTILFRLLEQQQDLNPVRTIITGSAPLNAALYHKTIAKYPTVQIFNLYGSSETGINIYANAMDLAEHPESIGKAIKGVQIQIRDENQRILNDHQIGLLWSKCAWSVRPNQWMQCGDLAYRDEQGYFYLKGRQDDMLICGGVNVYPIDLENILLKHPDIKAAQAFAIHDEQMGQCLASQIILKNHQVNNVEFSQEIQTWLKTQTPRYLRPKYINIVTEIATDSIGKPIITANKYDLSSNNR
ncbi:class I adenylate-forming enzyme family protein [Acinetobacter gerneri]|uniref:Class I adenylate-forming enzyme family protein n=2 Tax=Acinetobacter gerneri TaxID=202952 RepID=A0AAW8JCF1_9GAMM|nr:class I adenylate-forming enzyme family protein [Acinetobacter gerneri]MDQ9061382.1 class I adenylate-forming enzyme family protein [Acinetobacter gerneri]MDQ9070421.1 class I adenylate-forming enzyme family protein [Acinetobacter gerneri]